MSYRGCVVAAFWAGMGKLRSLGRKGCLEHIMWWLWGWFVDLGKHVWLLTSVGLNFQICKFIFSASKILNFNKSLLLICFLYISTVTAYLNLLQNLALIWISFKLHIDYTAKDNTTVVCVCHSTWQICFMYV